MPSRRRRRVAARLLAGGPHDRHEERGGCAVDDVWPDAPAESCFDDSCSCAKKGHAINRNGTFVAAAFLLHDAVSAGAAD